VVLGDRRDKLGEAHATPPISVLVSYDRTTGAELDRREPRRLCALDQPAVHRPERRRQDRSIRQEVVDVTIRVRLGRGCLRQRVRRAGDLPEAVPVAIGAPHPPEGDGLLLAVHHEHRHVEVIPVTAGDVAPCGVQKRHVGGYRLQRRAARGGDRRHERVVHLHHRVHRVEVGGEAPA
jgi:hypothetical protein